MLCRLGWVRCEMWERRDVCLCLLWNSLKFKSWQVNTPNVQVCSPRLHWLQGETRGGRTQSGEEKKIPLCSANLLEVHTLLLFCQIKHATYFHIYSIENIEKRYCGISLQFHRAQSFFFSLMISANDLWLFMDPQNDKFRQFQAQCWCLFRNFIFIS